MICCYPLYLSRGMVAVASSTLLLEINLSSEYYWKTNQNQGNIAFSFIPILIANLLLFYVWNHSENLGKVKYLLWSCATGSLAEYFSTLAASNCRSSDPAMSLVNNIQVWLMKPTSIHYILKQFNLILKHIWVYPLSSSSLSSEVSTLQQYDEII